MGKVGVITGASSGIGRATAEHLARNGYSLAVIARREALLTSLVDSLKQQFPNGAFIAYAGDVSSWSDVDTIAKEIEADWPCVNVLINNAGAFDYAPLEKATLRPPSTSCLYRTEYSHLLHIVPQWFWHVARTFETRELRLG